MAVWYESDNPNGYVTGKRFSIDKPCVTVMAAGMGGDSYGHWHFRTDGKGVAPVKKVKAKPPYRVPAMDDIRQVPWNGLKVASTFSGCGGSCLGYRMAGFRVIWANELDPKARASYKANHATTLDKRDIRNITPESILKATGLSMGELDVFDGSPPCQGFSTAGKRVVGDKRNNLFHEYSRLLKGIQPRVFIAENVSGMAKGTMKGLFIEVLKELKGCGYRVKCKVLDAQWLGVPQVRKRLIFIGVREDIGREPEFPKPLQYRYSVRDALPAMQATMEGVGPNVRPNKPGNSFPRNKRSDSSRPSGTITTGSGQINGSPAIAIDVNGQRKFTIDELKRICAFPDDFKLRGSYADQWARLGNSVPPVMMFHIASEVRELLPTPKKSSRKVKKKSTGP